jgi:GNAT superfamily N-acetyltransferase
VGQTLTGTKVNGFRVQRIAGQDVQVLVTTRRGTAEDAPALARLRWRWRSENRDEPAGDRATFLDFFCAWTIDHLATHLPFVAEVDGRLSGMAWLNLGERVPSPTRLDRRMGDVQSVYVVPELRNSGVGALLIGAILDEARIRELELVTVHSADRAVPFYLRCGFKDGQNWLEWRPERT